MSDQADLGTLVTLGFTFTRGVLTLTEDGAPFMRLAGEHAERAAATLEELQRHPGLVLQLAILALAHGVRAARLGRFTLVKLEGGGHGLAGER